MLHKILCFLFLLVATQAFSQTYEHVLQWKDNSVSPRNEDGTIIERKGPSDTGFIEIDRVEQDVLTFTDAAPPDSNLYCYRVISFNAAGSANASNISCADVPVPNKHTDLSDTATQIP